MKNPWIAQQRAVFAPEIAVPAQKVEIAAMLVSEGDAQQTFESLCNRTLYLKAHGEDRTLHQMLHSGFYGPINRGKLPHFIAAVNANANLRNSMFYAIDTVMSGSDTIQGYTDQGLPTDPNGWRQPQLRIGGNIYNDWDGGPGGHATAEAWREWFEISALQAALKALLDPQAVGGLEISGTYDDATKATVELFQQENKLEVDGIAGPLTWAAINKKLAA